MFSTYFVFFLCTVMGGTFVECQSILKQISSGNNVCNSEKLFKDFDLSKISQFDGMCSGIGIPQKSEGEFLLENNIVPILCMGLYEVTLKLCKLASDDTLRIEIFPPKVDAFTKLFKMLDGSNEFSSLEPFCSNTVKNCSVKKSSSNITQFWWEMLNEQLNDKNTCVSICHTRKNNKVNPLCSYIMWANKVYKDGLNDGIAILASGKEQNDVPKENLETLNAPIEQTNQAVVSASDNLSEFEPPENNLHPEDSGDFPLAKQPPYQVEGALPSVEPITNTTPKLAGTVLGMDEPPSSVQGTSQEEQMRPTQEKLPVPSSNVANAIPVADTGVKPTKSDKPKKKHMKKKPAVPKNATSYPESNVNESSKTNVGNNLPLLSSFQVDNEANRKAAPEANLKTEEAVETKPKIDETKSKTDEAIPNIEEAKLKGDEIKPESDQTEPKASETKPETDTSADTKSDFNFNEPPETVVTEPKIEGEKDFQLPYQDGPDEDDDGDDIEVDADGIVKTAPDKSGPSKSAASTNKQEVGQQVDDQEIIIEDPFIEAEDSHFFTYFLCMAVLTIMAYLAFHNKKKLVALAVEGRRNRGTRRRPNSSNYSKLDCSLEEAMVSNTTASVTHVLY